MTRTKKDVCEDRGLTGTEAADRNIRGSRVVFGVCAFLVLAALACGGCQSPLPPLPNPPGPHTSVRLSPGDVIKVAYADETMPDQTQKIRSDGKVSLPLIGELTAAGKKPIDFQHELVRRYESHLDSPEVLVTLEDGRATVTVSGFANRPGGITFDRPTTVYQAIMLAGGVSDYGSASNVHLTRIIDGVQLTETINLRPTIHGKPTKPKYVQDGDVIYIARNWF
jgi:polysaccharide biosynthesis/export protein